MVLYLSTLNHLLDNNGIFTTDSLKSSIEQRRIAMAVQGLVNSDVAEYDPKEEELKKQIESEKERLVPVLKFV